MSVHTGAEERKSLQEGTETMVTIDPKLCIGCGVCVKDCPGHVIHIKEGKAEVTGHCIKCGHCVAVCPVKAVSIPEYDMEDVEEFVPETFRLSPENYLHAVKFRRSIRDFKEQPLEKEILEHILNAGRYTATAKNAQACTFVVVQDGLDEFKKLFWEEMPSILEVLKEKARRYVRPFTFFYEMWKQDPKNDTFFFNTPCLVVIAAENTLDAGLAAANMENQAVAEGAGILYSGYLVGSISASPKLREWLGTGDKPIACCMLAGYPAVSYKRTAPRKKADIIWK